MGQPHPPRTRGACRGIRCLISLLCAAVAVVAAVRPAAAQTTRDTTRTAQERVMDRLRSIRPLITPDSILAREDSLGADSLNDRRPLAPGEEAGPPPGSLTGVTRDSVMERLLGIEGYVSTEYKGGRAVYSADSSRLQLRDTAEVLREGQRLTADSLLTYWDQRSLACAYGQPEISGTQTAAPVTSDSLCYNIERRLGVARNAQTTISEMGGTWFVHGDELVTVGDSVYTHDALFSDCDLPYPHKHYYFAAKEMKAVRDHVLVARNVTLNFADVPVFWLPFYVQSLSSGRRSGILFPRFGINDIVRNSTRYNRSIENVGFYWAINDYLGAQFAFAWQSNNYKRVDATFDYNFLRQFLSGGATINQYWKAEGGREFTIASRNSWQPDERTRIALTANYATSTQFIEQRSLDPRELRQSIMSNVGINRRFDWGTVALTGRRNQYISNGTVDTDLPNLDISLSPLTLFEALPGEERWYSNATWTSSLNADVQTKDIGAGNPDPTARGTRDITGNVTSSLTLGPLSWSQNIRVRDNLEHARDFAVDSLGGIPVEDLPERHERTLDWNTGFGYQQRLIGTSTFTPGLSLRGGAVRDSLTGAMVNAPLRLDFSAAIRTDLFGFWPGFGPYERFRHRFSPGITYTYSPEPNVTPDQARLFGTGADEQNRISIQISQSFEAKPKKQEGDSTQAAADTLGFGTDTTGLDSLGLSGGPRRRDEVRPIQILSLTTSALVYDFVQARRNGQGIQTAQISNNVQSDLFRGLQLSFTHDLFKPVVPVPGTTDTTGTSGIPAVQPREFSLHLSQVNASFSINQDSWIAKLLHLSPGREEGDTARGAQPDTFQTGPAGPIAGPTHGLMGDNRGQLRSAPRGPVGSWNASVSYTLSRPRSLPGAYQQPENQMLTANISFQPTEKWSLQWSTGYSFTTHDFTDHFLTLTRALHDFDANFDFVKAQNGNFSFQFRVHLRANPDLKFDYEQRDVQGLPGGRRTIRR